MKVPIGSTFKNNNAIDGLPDEEELTVGGYVYYEGTMYYTVVGEDLDETYDMHHLSVEGRYAA